MVKIPTINAFLVKVYTCAFVYKQRFVKLWNLGHMIPVRQQKAMSDLETNQVSSKAECVTRLFCDFTFGMANL